MEDEKHPRGEKRRVKESNKDRRKWRLLVRWSNLSLTKTITISLSDTDLSAAEQSLSLTWILNFNMYHDIIQFTL